MKKNIALIGITSLLFLFSTAHATVWYVHPDSTLNSIQTGLDSCFDSDTVLVGPGTYYENIVWPNTQGIHLMSELGPEATIIDGDNIGTVIYCSNDSCVDTTVIRGFTIQNGYTTDFGGGIACSGHGYPGGINIVDNIIRDNTASWGGAIACMHSYLIICGNTITENTGEGIHIGYVGRATITYNTVTFTSGSGIVITGGMGCPAHADISYNTISYNTTTGSGGGIWTIGTGTISHNTISYNKAENRGGGIEFWGNMANVLHNTIDYNTAQNGGGGVSITGYWGWMPHSFSKNTISYNTAPIGAGIYCAGRIDYQEWLVESIDSCIISCNIGDGVAYDSIVADTISLTINFCEIFDNSGYGVRNLDTIWINAEYNWWGDATGPYHPDSNPGGLGDSVSDYVDFTPWLDRPVSQPAAMIDIDPNTLNLKSHGKWITCYTEFSEGYSVEDIDINSVAIISIDGDSIDPLYRSGPATIGDYDEDGIPDLMVKFDRQALIAVLRTMIEPPAYVELEVGGILADSVPYSGVDTIRVISPGHQPERYKDRDGKHIARLCGLRPNPFTKKTEISYEIPDMSNAEIKIYDATGCLVRQWDNPTLKQYDHVFWDGTDRANRKLPNGVYFIELRSQESAETRKLMLIR